MFWFNKKVKKAAVFMLLFLGITAVTTLSGIGRATASATQTVTVSFDKSTSSSRSQTVTIPNLGSIISVTVNTGNVSYSVSGNNVTVSVSGGSPVDSYTPSTYKTVTSSYTDSSSSASFSSTYYYNDGYYSGTLYQSGSSSTTLIQSAASKFVSYFWGSIDKTDYVMWTGSQWVDYDTLPHVYAYYEYYSDADGYSGTLSRQLWYVDFHKYVSPPAKGSYVGQTFPTQYYTDYYNMEGTVYRPALYSHSQSYAGYVYGPTTYYYTYTVTITYKLADTTPPSISVNPTSRDWSNTSVSVNYSVTDSETGVGTVQYAWSPSTSKPSSWAGTGVSGSLSYTSEGTVYLHIQAWDNAGNYAYNYFGPYKIDKDPPAVTAYPPMRDWDNTDVAVTLTYSDSGGSGLSLQQYAWSTSTTTPTTWANYTGPVTQTGNGTWYLHAKVTDTAGNSYTTYFGPYKIDKTLPTVTASLTTRNWANTDVTVTLTYSDSGGSGLSMQQYAWSTSTATPTSWTNYTGAVTQTSNGTWYLHYKVSDVAGNTVTAYFGPYKIDKTLPTITASPATRDWDVTPVTVTLTYSDSGGSGLALQQYAWSTSTTAPTTWSNYTGPVTQSSVGIWYLHAKAVDIAGNSYTTYFGPYKVNALLYITIEPSSATIVRTETLPLAVKAVYYNGTVNNVTAAAAYSSSNTSIASVNSQGVVTGNAVGQAVITAVYSGKQAQSTITVQEPEKAVSAGEITITKDPTYIYTLWHKDSTGQQAHMNITVSWSNLNLLILRADSTVLRSEPITVTKAESQHRIDRYTLLPSYSWGTLVKSSLTDINPGNGVYQATYQYDKAGKETSPFTFTGYYTYEGQEKSFSITVDIPVNGVSTSLFKVFGIPTTSDFIYALTNDVGNNTWKYKGVWPASGVLTIGGASGEMLWPVPGNTVISSYYGRRIDPITGVVTMHHGIDIPAPDGTAIVSPASGTVVYTGWSDDYGNMLVIRSGGYDFLFGHCSSILVTTGQPVSKGQAVAKVGSTGRSTGPHLDLRVTSGSYTQGNYIDPLTVVKP